MNPADYSSPPRSSRAKSLLETASEQHRSGPPRLSALLEARPASPLRPEASQSGVRHQDLIEGLRHRIRTLEQHPPVLTSVSKAASWRLGAAGLDGWFCKSGLNAAAVHEIKPAHAGAGSETAAMLFLLRLLVRRRAGLKSLQNASDRQRILWCSTAHTARESGQLYAPGLAALGLDPAHLIIVEAARTQDVLWVLEEGLRSGGLAAVAGAVPDVALTPARRLSLAAEQCLTPCLLLTAARAPSTAATATRWRIGPAPTAAHAYDARAPGLARATVALERGPHQLTHHVATTLDPITLEWSDVTQSFQDATQSAQDITHRFDLAPALAHRTVDAPKPGRRAA